MVETIARSKKYQVMLKDVMYAPGMMNYLISISKMVRNEVRVTVNKDISGWGTMELLQKPTGFVHMIGVDTKKGIFQAVMY